jgi:hypothetical protein
MCVEINVWHVKKRGDKVIVFCSVHLDLDSPGSYGGVEFPADLVERVTGTTNPDALMAWHEYKLEKLVKYAGIRWPGKFVPYEEPTRSSR